MRTRKKLEITRCGFSSFTDDELDVMESALDKWTSEIAAALVNEICEERLLRQKSKREAAKDE